MSHALSTGTVQLVVGGVLGSLLVGAASAQSVVDDISLPDGEPVAFERGPYPSTWIEYSMDPASQPQLRPSAENLLFGDQSYSVYRRSGVLEPGRYERLPMEGGSLRMVSGDYRVQTLNVVGASFDVDTSAGNVWLSVQDSSVPVASGGSYTHRVDTGAELVLGPGASGSVFAAAGSVVRVTAGTYSFDSVVLSEGARFVADESEGDVVLSVRGALVADRGVQLEFVGGAVFLTESLDGVGTPVAQRENFRGPRGFAPTGGGGGGGSSLPTLQDLLDDPLDDPLVDDDISDDALDDLPDETGDPVPTPGAGGLALLGMLAASRRRRCS